MLDSSTNISYKDIILNTCSPVYGAVGEVMKLLGHGNLLEEECHCGQALRVYSISLFILSFSLYIENMSSHLPALVAMPPYHDELIPLDKLK